MKRRTHWFQILGRALGALAIGGLIVALIDYTMGAGYPGATMSLSFAAGGIGVLLEATGRNIRRLG